MDIDGNRVIAKLQESELGRALLEKAMAQVEVDVLREEVARLRNAQNQAAPTGTPDSSPGEVPPAGEPDPVPAP